MVIYYFGCLMMLVLGFDELEMGVGLELSKVIVIMDEWIKCWIDGFFVYVFMCCMIW